MVPGPRSRPRPEVVVAATTTGTVELAARRRLPLLLGMYADDDEKAAMVRHYAAVAGGRHVPHVSAGLARVADSDDEATALIRARLPSWLGPGLVGYRRADTDSLTAPATPTTTPNCCAASIPSAHIPSAQPSGAATGWPAPPAAPASGT